MNRVFFVVILLVGLVSALGLGFAAAQISTIPINGQFVSATGLPIVDPDDVAAPSGSTQTNLEDYLKATEGEQGPQGIYRALIYRKTDNGNDDNPPPPPGARDVLTGGLINVATGQVTLPSGWEVWSTTIVTPEADKTLWLREYRVNPARMTGHIVPSWSVAYELTGGAGLPGPPGHSVQPAYCESSTTPGKPVVNYTSRGFSFSGGDCRWSVDAPDARNQIIWLSLIVYDDHSYQQPVPAAQVGTPVRVGTNITLVDLASYLRIPEFETRVSGKLLPTVGIGNNGDHLQVCLLYTSPSPRDS